VLLALDSVRKSYWRGSTEVPVLKDVCLEVQAGEFVAVYGKRAAGKTTLLKIAAALEAPDSGVACVAGRELSTLSRGELARLHRGQIGWVSRSGPQSKDLPVDVHVALPLYGRLGPRAAARRGAAALALVGAEDYVGELWDDLPDTARTLVAIAQALVREPALLVVDDPVAGLGIIDREQVLARLRSAAEDQGIGILMAVPEMPAMLRAHHVRTLVRGCLLTPAVPSEDDQGAAVIDFPGGGERRTCSS
jgi:ABC-type lipoprotein export system ATPase subunit